MTITREQIADLRVGDVVEIRDDRYPHTVIRGPLVEENGTLLLGGYITVRYATDNVFPVYHEHREIAVIERAPRPLYVNHDRTKPVPGDVVRDADSDNTRVWMFIDAEDTSTAWVAYSDVGSWWKPRREMPERLRLLVDGETGQVVS